MRTERSYMRRSLSLVVAALCCALAVSQSTKPLSTVALSNTPTLAIHCQKLARYPVEEVGGKPIEPNISSLMMVSLFVAEPKRESAVTSEPDETDMPDWPFKCLFHRRTPPPSPDDGN